MGGGEEERERGWVERCEGEIQWRQETQEGDKINYVNMKIL